MPVLLGESKRGVDLVEGEILDSVLWLLCVMMRSSLKSDLSTPRTYFSNLSMCVLIFRLSDESLLKDLALQTQFVT